MITVVVADDQTMIRSALAALLSLETDIDVVGQAGDCAGALELIGSLRPDVALIDVQMPPGRDLADGIDVTAGARAVSPGTRVIVLTTFGRPGYLRRTLEAGAVGFMVKDAPPERLIEGIRRAAAGLRVVDPELAVASLSVGPSPLTARETEVLRAVRDGGTTADVARRVFLSEGTVRNHLSSAIGKAGATNRAEALRIATENGWL